jgi:outer membrane receptor protein involved in Fe transport
VRLDGLPLNERVQVHGHGYVDLYNVVPEAVQELRVEKGPFLPGQGDFATAGSVDFVLGLPPSRRPGLVRVEGSQHGRLRAATVVAPADAPADALLAAEAVHDEGYGPHREADRGGLLAAWSWEAGPDARLALLATLQTARWESPGVLRFDALAGGRDFFDAYDPAGRGESDRALARLTWRRTRPDQELALAFAGTWRRLLLEDDYTGWLLQPETGDRQRQEQAGFTLGSTLTLRQRLSGPMPGTLLGGLGWRTDQAALGARPVSEEGEAGPRDRDQQARAHELYVYGGLRLRPGAGLELLPSLRGEVLSLGVDDTLEQRSGSQVLGALLPRLTVSWHPAAALTLFVAAGQGFRSPEARSVLAPRATTVEDADLSRYAGGTPEITRADALEAGVHLQPHPALRVRLAGFATRIARELIFDHVSATLVEQDGTRRRGAELAVELRPVPWGELAADASFVDARFARSGNPVPGTTRWSGRGVLALGRPRGPHGSAALGWASTRLLAHGATVSGLVRADLTGGWRFAWGDVSLAVDNVGDARTLDGAYHYASWFDRTTPRSALPVVHYTAAPPRTARLVLTGYL